MRRVKLGVVGVDSGQLLVCDPCYIGSEWEQHEFKDVRRFKDTILDRVFEYKKDFEHFDVVLSECDFGTPNSLIQSGRWIPVEVPEKVEMIGNFSYAGICETTLANRDNKLGGQLNYKLGHPGAGVAFSSGLGDGTYEVWAEVEDCNDWGERITRVIIEMPYEK